MYKRQVRGFANERGWFTYPSQSNFIFTEPRNARGESGPAVARSLYDFLYANKVLAERARLQSAMRRGRDQAGTRPADLG